MTQVLQSNLKSHKSENTLLQERVKNLETSLADAQITSKGDDASGTTLHTTFYSISIPFFFIPVKSRLNVLKCTFEKKKRRKELQKYKI